MGVDVERTSVNASGSNDLQTPTDVTQGTDVHQSKIAPDDPRLRIDRPKGRTLKRGPVLLVGAVLAGLLAVGLVVALVGPTKDAEAKRNSAPTDAPAATPPLPDVIADPPSEAERHSTSGAIGRGHTRAAGPPNVVSAEPGPAAHREEPPTPTHHHGPAGLLRERPRDEGHGHRAIRPAARP